MASGIHFVIKNSKVGCRASQWVKCMPRKPGAGLWIARTHLKDELDKTGICNPCVHCEKSGGTEKWQDHESASLLQAVVDESDLVSDKEEED